MKNDIVINCKQRKIDNNLLIRKDKLFTQLKSNGFRFNINLGDVNNVLALAEVCSKYLICWNLVSQSIKVANQFGIPLKHVAYANCFVEKGELFVDLGLKLPPYFELNAENKKEIRKYVKSISEIFENILAPTIVTPEMFKKSFRAGLLTDFKLDQLMIESMLYLKNTNPIDEFKSLVTKNKSYAKNIGIIKIMYYRAGLTIPKIQYPRIIEVA